MQGMGGATDGYIFTVKFALCLPVHLRFISPPIMVINSSPERQTSLSSDEFTSVMSWLQNTPPLRDGSNSPPGSMETDVLKTPSTPETKREILEVPTEGHLAAPIKLILESDSHSWFERKLDADPAGEIAKNNSPQKIVDHAGNEKYRSMLRRFKRDLEYLPAFATSTDSISPVLGSEVDSASIYQPTENDDFVGSESSSISIVLDGQRGRAPSVDYDALYAGASSIHLNGSTIYHGSDDGEEGRVQGWTRKMVAWSKEKLGIRHRKNVFGFTKAEQRFLGINYGRREIWD
ncbi:hypothetical protein P7C73_g6226, partial [Tremellales sp. Uapishka_1]